MIVAAVLFLLAAASSAPPPEGHPGPRWIEGPVRYLLTAGEEREARTLRSEQEYRDFVARFWMQRDPLPDSPQNEFQDDFRRRVERANRLFAETTKPGWKTDRGKIYILLGPPDETTAPAMESDRRGIVAWVYRNTPQPDLGPQVVVRFVEDRSGEYRLTSDAFADSRILPSEMPVFSRRPLPGPPVADGASALADQVLQSRLQNVPIPVRSPHVDIRWTAHGNPFRSCASFYLSEDRSTLMTLTLEVQPAFLREDPDYRPEAIRALGHLASLDGRERIDLGALAAQTPYPDPSSEQPLRFQGLRSLRPGRYRAYLALVDDRQRLRGSHHQDLEIPSIPADRLALSSPTLVEILEEAAPTHEASRLEAYRIGHLRVVPRCEPSFGAAEELELYYQIYDGRGSVAGEAPGLDIEYRFDLVLDGERYRIGAPLRLHAQRSRVQGQTFRLQGWPRGSYVMSMIVSDPSAGARAAREVAFEVR